jgi:hypothetical protein
VSTVHRLYGNACCQRDVDRLAVRDIAELLEQGQLPRKSAGRVFRRVSDRYQARDVLTDAELDALGRLRDRLTELINPCPVEELDQRMVELDAKFPDWEHSYHRVGTLVTWSSRPRSPDHVLWKYYPHDAEEEAEQGDKKLSRQQRTKPRGGRS